MRSDRPRGSACLLAAPTIAAHGNERQKQEDLLRILNGQDAWCQLFSEPGAGSDLAGLQTKAIKDGDEWIITGQKVWTSTAQMCNLGMLIARTDPNLPKHKGISYFKFDMLQPGVEIRPLREMTGRAMFNEVFIDNARVRDDDMIGGLNNGWAVANTTLMAERSGLGTGGSGAVGFRVRGADREAARQPRRRSRRPGAHRWHRRRRSRPPAQSLVAAGARSSARTKTRSSARSWRSSTRSRSSDGCRRCG